MKVKRAARDELGAKLDEYIKSMETNAASLLNIPMPEADEYMFSLFDTTGNRQAYESIYFQRRKYLAVYGGLTIFQEPSRYLAKLEEVICGICEEECWALPAHVNRAGNPAWHRTVDLFAAETGQALALVLSLAGEKLQPKIRELARKNVMERVLLPFMESQPPYLPWERGDNVFDLDGNLLEGSIPIKQKKYMLAWIAIHEEDLKANWELLQSGQEFFHIPPLQ